jgi:hypothetical protein
MSDNDLQLEERQVEGMLRGFLADSLNGYQGRSLKSFQKHLEAGPQLRLTSDLDAPPNPGLPKPKPIAGHSSLRQMTWLMGAFATGVAASLAIVWAVPALRTSVSPSPRFATQQTAPLVTPNRVSTQSNNQFETPEESFSRQPAPGFDRLMPFPFFGPQNSVTVTDGLTEAVFIHTNNHWRLVVKDRLTSQIRFNGPIDTAEQRSHLPANYRRYLEAAERVNAQLNLDAGDGNR